MTKQKPAGLIPRHVARKFRMREILEAIQRYLESEFQIPMEWVEELHFITDEINLDREMKRNDRPSVDALPTEAKETWAPDGKTLPPNVREFFDWAVGKARVCNRGQKDKYIMNLCLVDRRILYCTLVAGNNVLKGHRLDEQSWKRSDWMEYKEEKEAKEPWAPDGKTLPPNAPAFCEWARGRKITRPSDRRGNTHIKVCGVTQLGDGKYRICAEVFDALGKLMSIASDLEWRYYDWQEYVE